jgi:hypothetical protein
MSLQPFSTAVGVGHPDGAITALVTVVIPDDLATLVAVVNRVIDKGAVGRVLTCGGDSVLQSSVVVVRSTLLAFPIYRAKKEREKNENLLNSALIKVQPHTS